MPRQICRRPYECDRPPPTMPHPSSSSDMSAPSQGWIRPRGARLGGVLVLTCSLVLGACTSLHRTPYTAAEASTSRVLDIDGLRR